MGEESKIVVQMHSAKSKGDLYSKEIEERKKHEVKGKNLESDNKTLEPSMTKFETFNQRITRSTISVLVRRTLE